MADSKDKGLKRLIKAAGYSITGLKSAWLNEEAFRLEVILALIMIPGAFRLGTTAPERGILILSCIIVLITELINSAIEAMVDRIGPERHELSGRAKDIGSAAVFISLMGVVIVWSIVACARFCP